jgi:hypothetical protein
VKTRRSSKVVLPVVVVIAAARSTPQTPSGGRLPDAIVVRVDRVTVSANRTGTSNQWDGESPESGNDGICQLAAFGASLLNPVAGKGAELLCGVSVPSQRERDAASPDLHLRLQAGESVRFETPVEPDVVDHVFRYEFVVPVAAIPPDGIAFEVLDADVGQEAELIGAVRVSQQLLADTFQSSTRLVDLSSGAIAHLELVVSDYVPATFPSLVMKASDAPTALGDRDLLAGEVVTLHAEGSYKVGSWYDQQIDPVGYPGDQATGYNFQQEPFRSAPHACGIGLVRARGVVQGVIVAPDATFGVLYAGPLRVGLNDNDPSNNDGLVSFSGATRAPTPSEWGVR